MLASKSKDSFNYSEDNDMAIDSQQQKSEVDIEFYQNSPTRVVKQSFISNEEQNNDNVIINEQIVKIRNIFIFMFSLAYNIRVFESEFQVVWVIVEKSRKQKVASLTEKIEFSVIW